MFGPTACANQGWFEEFSKQYPMALDAAPAGIVPENFKELFLLQEWTPAEPQMEQFDFDSTKATRYGKRKAIKAMTEDEKKPKFTTSSIAVSSTATTATTTAAALEVKITMTAQDEERSTALQGYHDKGNRPTVSIQQNQQARSNIGRLDEAIRKCAAIHQAQAEALKVLCNQMQLVKEEHRAKEKRLEILLAQERSEKDVLQDKISRLEQAIMREHY